MLDPHATPIDLARHRAALGADADQDAAALLRRVGISGATVTGRSPGRLDLAATRSDLVHLLECEEGATLHTEPLGRWHRSEVRVPGPIEVVAVALTESPIDIPAHAWADDDTLDGPAPTVDADASGRILRGLVAGRRIDPEARLAVQHLATLAASPTGRLDPDALAILRDAVAVLWSRS